MIQQRSDVLAALKSLLIAEICSNPWRCIGPSSALSMATPFPRAVPQVIKIEDVGNYAPGGQASGVQELMDRFRNNAPPPPVYQPLPLPPPPPHSTRAKRLATGPPPGFAGVRQPPQKPLCQRAPQHAPQPAPNAHRAPGAPVQTLVHAGQGAAPPAPLNTVVKPPLQLQRRSAPKPRHPAAKKKPTVPCGLCGVLCMTARHLKQHEQGRKHRNKAAYLAGEMNVQCPVCNVHLSSGLNVEQHNAGKQHLRRLNGGA